METEFGEFIMQLHERDKRIEKLEKENELLKMIVEILTNVVRKNLKG